LTEPQTFKTSPAVLGVGRGRPAEERREDGAGRVSRQFVYDTRKIEISSFLGDPGNKDDLQEQVGQLFAQFPGVPDSMASEDLVGFLDQIFSGNSRSARSQGIPKGRAAWP
jgi:hypothetical protein